MHRVVFVAFEGAQSLDLTGPLECFYTATRVLEARGRPGGYDTRVAANRPGVLRTSSGLGLVADHALGRLRKVDTLVVVGGEGTRAATDDPTTIGQVHRLAGLARRVTSVCTGAFVLAAAGLLDGRPVTTHWRWARQLQRRFPEVDVQPDRIFVTDGSLSTSAGVTAGIDLALAMIEEDFGRDVARDVARLLVVYLRRPGGQSQFSASLSAQFEGPPALSDLVAWIESHPGEDLCVERLAARAHMSPRHFARVFSQQVGATPAKLVHRIRIEAARRALEDSSQGVDTIAARCGFGTAESMRRAFHRALGLSPAEYRARFNPDRTTP